MQTVILYTVSIAVIFWLSGIYYRVGNVVINNSKIRYVFYLIALFLIIRIFTNSMEAIDSVNYSLNFDELIRMPDVFRGKGLSHAIMYVIKTRGLTYQFFRTFTGIVFCLPAAYIIRNNQNVSGLKYIALIMLYPLSGCAVNLFQSLALSVCTLAIYVYIRSEKKIKNGLVSILMITSSYFLHDTSIIILLVFLVYLTSDRWLPILRSKFFIFAYVVIGCLMIRFGGLGVYIGKVFAADYHREGYIDNLESAGIGFLVPVAVHLLCIYLLRKIFNIRRASATDRENAVSECTEIINFSYVTILIIPLYAFNLLFMRMFRVFFCIFAIMYADKALSMKKHNMEYVLLGVIIFGCILVDGVSYISTLF